MLLEAVCVEWVLLLGVLLLDTSVVARTVERVRYHHPHTITPSHPRTVVVYIPTLTLTHTIALLPLSLDVLSSRPFAVRHSS